LVAAAKGGNKKKSLKGGSEKLFSFRNSVCYVIQDTDGIKLQVDVIGLDLTVRIDRWQVVE